MRPKYLVAILVLLALAAPAAPAHAGGLVSICDEAHLLAALAGGGTVTFNCSGTITLTAQITIAADTTIDGSGQAVTISGNNAVRVFAVDSGGALNLNRLTIVNGYERGGGSIYNGGTLTVSNSTFSDNNAYWGGGIENGIHGTLIVSNSTFSGNHAFHGGGILNGFGGTLTVSNSTFSGNSADPAGGGINNNNGTLTVSNSTFSANSAIYGGGIFNRDQGTVTVSDSTFSGNSAIDGGGIDNDNGGTLIVSNSTFSANTTTGAGGGIYNSYFSMMTLSNSTFSDNSALEGGGIKNGGILTVSSSTFTDNSASSAGGGIYDAPYGAMTLENTIVANSPAGGNCSGTITDGGGNLSYPDATCPGINSDPVLGPLQINGGPTETMEPGPSSAARDAANDATCAAPPVNNLDQRGIVRPQGSHCDIGAVERLPFRIWFALMNSQ